MEAATRFTLWFFRSHLTLIIAFSLCVGVAPYEAKALPQSVTSPGIDDVSDCRQLQCFAEAMAVQILPDRSLSGEERAPRRQRLRARRVVSRALRRQRHVIDAEWGCLRCITRQIGRRPGRKKTCGSSTQCTAVSEETPGSGESELPTEPSSEASSCELVNIDFEQVVAGTILSSVNAADGSGPVAVSGENRALGPSLNAAVVYDSACVEGCSGGDPDLGTPNRDFGGPGRGDGGSEHGGFPNDAPQGNVLIVGENLDDLDGDFLVDSPDDQGSRRVSLEFTFDAERLGAVELLSMTVIDIESKEAGASAEVYSAGGELIKSFPLPVTGNNGVANVQFSGAADVAKLVVTLHGSGAIDDITFRPAGCEKDESLCRDDVCPSALEFSILGGTNHLGETGVSLGATDLGIGSSFSVSISAPWISMGAPWSDGTEAGSTRRADILGWIPQPNNCRCKGDPRVACDEAFGRDMDCPIVNPGPSATIDQTCECFLGAPDPTISSAVVPICSVRQVAEDVSGWVDLDTGDYELNMFIRQFGHFGDLPSPCPTCEGDVTPNDGVREGVCVSERGEPMEGPLPCDAHSFFATLPVGTDGAYTSLDCRSAGFEASQGITIRHQLTTRSSSLSRQLDCSNPLIPTPIFCHCGVCSDDSERACSADADCAHEAKCVKTNNGSTDSVNTCGDGVCSAIGGGLGECRGNTTTLWCDGAVTEAGLPYRVCNEGGVCAIPVNETETIDFGSCSVELYPKCVTDEVELNGSPGFDQVTLVSARCGIAKANIVNTTSGLPGPALLNLKMLVAPVFDD